MHGLFSLCYFGSIAYYKDLLSCDKITFERFESWQKQSYRNRMYIDGPNDKLMLNIPIEHQGVKQLFKDVKISYQDNWLNKHWQALLSSYNGSPFFEILSRDIQLVFQKKHSHLFELNLELTLLVLKWLNVDAEINFSRDWKQDPFPLLDFREKHHPKKDQGVVENVYPQVFRHKSPFKSNLSILDLLFNEGPAAFDYLKED